MTNAAHDDDSPSQQGNLVATVAPEVVAALDQLCRRRHIERDEGIRRAIALWNYLEEQQDHGRTLAVIERDSRREVISELTLT
jgi:hypothetical protein